MTPPRLTGSAAVSEMIRIYFYLHPDQDGALLSWVCQQPNRSAAIRQALRAWVVQDEGSAVSSRSDLDVSTLRAVLREELAHARTLGPTTCRPLASGEEDDDLRAALDEFAQTWDFDEGDTPP